MKINGPTLKLKPLQLLIGVGIIMAGFLSEVNAAPFKCTRCNLSAKKCATDQKYFETCVSRCPTKNNKNPIPKCTKAHYDAIQASKPSTDALSELLNASCDKKNALIKMHNAAAAAQGKLPYSTTEKDFILRGCNKQSADSPKSPNELAPPVTQKEPTDSLKHSSEPPPLPPRDSEDKIEESDEKPNVASDFQSALVKQRTSLRKSGNPYAAPSDGAPAKVSKKHTPPSGSLPALPSDKTTASPLPPPGPGAVPTPPPPPEHGTVTPPPPPPPVDMPAPSKARAGLLADLNNPNPLAGLKKRDANTEKPASKAPPPSAKKDLNAHLADALNKMRPSINGDGDEETDQDWDDQ